MVSKTFVGHVGVDKDHPKFVGAHLVGKICIDRTVGGDKVIISNLLTYERRSVPQSQYSICMDDSGTTFCIIDEGTDQIFEYEDFFRSGVVVDLAGNAHLTDHNHLEHPPVDLDRQRCRHRVGTCGVKLGGTLATVKLQVAVMQQPRLGNGGVSWSLESLYRQLGFIAWDFLGTWVSRSISRWKKSLKKVSGYDEDQFIQSTL